MYFNHSTNMVELRFHVLVQMDMVTHGLPTWDSGGFPLMLVGPRAPFSSEMPVRENESGRDENFVG